VPLLKSIEDISSEGKAYLVTTSNDELNMLHEALESLPDMYRQVLSLYYLSGMDHKEIAGFIGVSPTNVLQRLHRAREQLREEMISMMTTAFKEQKLSGGFTFRIIELVKKIKIHPISTIKGLPYGVSLATGLIFTTLMFFCPNLINFNFQSNSVSSTFFNKNYVLKSGKIPVDIIKTSNRPIISHQKDNKGKINTDSENAFFLAPQEGEGKWTQKGDMPFTNSWAPACVFGGKIYIFGHFAQLSEYDPLTDTYIQKGNGGKGGDYDAIALDDKIYVTDHWGGMYEYDPIADKWTKKADSKFDKRGTALATLNGKIYAIGGVTAADTVMLSVVQEYDPANDTWTRKKDLILPLAWCSACTFEDKIYVFGGWNGGGAISTTMTYDPNEDKWVKKTNMPNPMVFIHKSAPIIDGKAYIIGGYGNNLPRSEMQIYDFKTDTWEKGHDMPTARYGSAVASYKNRIYVFGGATGADFVNNQIWTSKVEEYEISVEDPKLVDTNNKIKASWGNIKSNF